MSVDSVNAPLLETLAMMTPDPTRAGRAATPSDAVHSTSSFAAYPPAGCTRLTWLLQGWG